jgi:queuosine precursor transporter
VVMLPITYPVVGFLKHAERVDHYDYGTNFNPFLLR